MFLDIRFFLALGVALTLVISSKAICAPFQVARCVGSLAEIPFAVLRHQNTSILQQLYPLQPLHDYSSIYPFLSGNYTSILDENHASCSDVNGTGGNITAGFSQRRNEHFTWGLGISYASDSADCQKNLMYDLSTVSGVLFGNYHCPKGYANLILSGSSLNFSNIRRHEQIEHVHSNTDGSAYGCLINGGYYLWSFNNLLTGPIASIAYGSAHVNRYKEHHADIGNLEFDNQTGNNCVTGIGWEVDFKHSACDDSFSMLWNTCFPTLSEYGLTISISANHQWLKNEREVRFKDVDTSDEYSELPYKAHRPTYASGVANLYAKLCNRTVLSMGYFFNVGSNSISEHSLTLGITRRL